MSDDIVIIDLSAYVLHPIKYYHAVGLVTYGRLVLRGLSLTFPGHCFAHLFVFGVLIFALGPARAQVILRELYDFWLQSAVLNTAF